MEYEVGAQFRAMCERIARTLGHENPPDIIDPDPDYYFADGVIRIYDKGCWVDLSVKNSDGHYARALSIGGLTAKGNDDLAYAALDHIRGLYIASFLVPTISDQKEPAPCPN